MAYYKVKQVNDDLLSRMDAVHIKCFNVNHYHLLLSRMDAVHFSIRIGLFPIRLLSRMDAVHSAN